MSPVKSYRWPDNPSEDPRFDQLTDLRAEAERLGRIFSVLDAQYNEAKRTYVERPEQKSLYRRLQVWSYLFTASCVGIGPGAVFFIPAAITAIVFFPVSLNRTLHWRKVAFAKGLPGSSDPGEWAQFRFEQGVEFGLTPLAKQFRRVTKFYETQMTDCQERCDVLQVQLSGELIEEATTQTRMLAYSGVLGLPQDVPNTKGAWAWRDEALELALYRREVIRRGGDLSHGWLLDLYGTPGMEEQTEKWRKELPKTQKTVGMKPGYNVWPEMWSPEPNQDINVDDQSGPASHVDGDRVSNVQGKTASSVANESSMMLL